MTDCAQGNFVRRLSTSHAKCKFIMEFYFSTLWHISCVRLSDLTDQDLDKLVRQWYVSRGEVWSILSFSAFFVLRRMTTTEKCDKRRPPFPRPVHCGFLLQPSTASVLVISHSHGRLQTKFTSALHRSSTEWWTWRAVLWKQRQSAARCMAVVQLRRIQQHKWLSSSAAQVRSLTEQLTLVEVHLQGTDATFTQKLNRNLSSQRPCLAAADTIVRKFDINNANGIRVSAWSTIAWVKSV